MNPTLTTSRKSEKKKKLKSESPAALRAGLGRKTEWWSIFEAIFSSFNS